MFRRANSELEPWKDNRDVKEVEARIVEVYKSLAKVREGNADDPGSSSNVGSRKYCTGRVS